MDAAVRQAARAARTTGVAWFGDHYPLLFLLHYWGLNLDPHLLSHTSSPFALVYLSDRAFGQAIFGL
jgi:hypothetical protein